MMGTAFGAILFLLFPVVVGAIAYYDGYKNGRIDASIEMLGMADRTLDEMEKRR